MTEESVVTFSPHKASVEVISGPRAPHTVSSVGISVPVGIRLHLFTNVLLLFTETVHHIKCRTRKWVNR